MFAKDHSSDGLDKRAEDVIARLSGAVNSLAQRGRCKTCGGDGHLTFECRNNLKLTKLADKDKTAEQLEEVSSTSSESSDEEAPAPEVKVSKKKKKRSRSSSGSDSESEARKKKKKKKDKKKKKNKKHKKK